MSHLAISLLGPFQVTLDGNPVTVFGADTARALLAYLAMHAGVACRRDMLAGLLWPDRPEAVAHQNLRQALSRLRAAIGDREAARPFLLVTRKTIRFDSQSDYWLDAVEFDRLIAAADEHRHRRLQVCRSCMERLREAVQLYRGDFLAGFSLNSAPFEEWLVVHRERLHRQALEALYHLAAYYGRRGNVDRVIHYAQRQVALEPWREEAHRQWMRALALHGRRNAALAQYETCRRILASELDVEPAAETAALYGSIRDGSDLHSLSQAPPSNLPTPLTPLIGRETELAEIEARMQDPDCRLLTLVGPGGIGKTRLALEAAAEQVYDYDHGVFYVSLAPVQSAEDIVPAVAQALGFAFYGGSDPRRQLLGYLRRKELLLVLDNFEHLLHGADVVTDILRTAANVQILVTSRACLSVRGEQLLPVAGMGYPEQTLPIPEAAKISAAAARYSSVTLFAHSARRVRPVFTLTAGNVPHVFQICRLVQGMPLGILLAAAWVGVLSPAEIAQEIAKSFDFLQAEWHDVPARQRSMRAVIESMWTMLTETERQTFAKLSVFRGGCTREAAQQVAGADLKTLMSLVSKSVLEHTQTGRYEVHELLRQYAAEKLHQTPGKQEAVRDRHSAYYTAALHGWAAELRGPRQQVALLDVQADIGNARTAWDWAVERGQVERLSQAIDGLCLFCEWRGRYQEGEAACRIAAERLDSETFAGGSRVLAKVLAWHSAFNRLLGRIEPANQLAQRSLIQLEGSKAEGHDVRPARAFSLLQMGESLYDTDREGARQWYERSLALYRALGDPWGTATLLGRLGFLAVISTDYGQAKRLCRESLEIRQSLGDQKGTADALMVLSRIAGQTGQIEEAERLTRQAITLCREIGDRAGVATGLGQLAWRHMDRGKFAKAHLLVEEAVAIREDLGMRVRSAWANELLSWVKMHMGLYEQARELMQTDLAVFREADNQAGAGSALMGLGKIALAESAYKEAHQWLEKSAAVLRGLGAQGGLVEALAHLGHAALRLGLRPRAQQYLCEAWRTVAELEAPRPTLYPLATTALLLADQEKAERAVEVYALASRYPFVANSCWFENIAGKHIAAVAATLPPEAVSAAQERGQARNLEATVKELLAELAE